MAIVSVEGMRTHTCFLQIEKTAARPHPGNDHVDRFHKQLITSDNYLFLVRQQTLVAVVIIARADKEVR